MSDAKTAIVDYHKGKFGWRARILYDTEEQVDVCAAVAYGKTKKQATANVLKELSTIIGNLHALFSTLALDKSVR